MKLFLAGDITGRGKPHPNVFFATPWQIYNKAIIKKCRGGVYPRPIVDNGVGVDIGVGVNPTPTYLLPPHDRYSTKPSLKNVGAGFTPALKCRPKMPPQCPPPKCHTPNATAFFKKFNPTIIIVTVL